MTGDRFALAAVVLAIVGVAFAVFVVVGDVRSTEVAVCPPPVDCHLDSVVAEMDHVNRTCGIVVDGGDEQLDRMEAACVAQRGLVRIRFYCEMEGSDWVPPQPTAVPRRRGG